MNEWVRRAGGVALTLALSGSLLGCSRAHPRETIRGKVTYKGQPLPGGGFLHFYQGTSVVGIGPIRWDGSGEYEASVPAGPVQVIVKEDSTPDVDDLPPGEDRRLDLRMWPPGSPQARVMDEVVKKYGSRKTAKPLTFDVAAGEQTWNINLD